jgi:endonuclease/exonuclease/phosphatase family metal-dependent hydrolase
MKKKALLLVFIITLFYTQFSYAQIEVKAMSYNIRLNTDSDGENRWELRKEKLATLINYYNADFVGTQEVLYSQLVYLQKQLSTYNFVGVGRDDGKEAGEYSALFYKKDLYDVKSSGTFWLSPTPDTPSKGWDAALNRVCSYGLFQHKKTKQYVWVFNTHFDHVGKIARVEASKLIIEKIKTFNSKNYPVILTGDFNVRPEDAPIATITGSLVNSRIVSEIVHNNADTWNGFKFNEDPKGCIDYVFISKDPRIVVKKFITITDSYNKKYYSDHFPVMATLFLKKR